MCFFHNFNNNKEMYLSYIIFMQCNIDILLNYLLRCFLFVVYFCFNDQHSNNNNKLNVDIIAHTYVTTLLTTFIIW